MARLKISPYGKMNTVGQLGSEVFGLVQDAQGKGFISDGIEGLSDRKQFFGAVRGHLHHTERAAKIIRKFLCKHNEL